MPPIDWSALAIGLLICFYWSRVIKLVIKTKKRTGRAANFLPPETLGRILRIIWYPNVAAWAIVPLVVAFWPLKKYWYLPVLEWSAVTVATITTCLTLICWRKMGKDWRMGIDPQEKNTLIITGPYAMVRHPIYALQCLLAIVSFVAVPILGLAIIAGLQVILLQWEARREEKHMLSVHGETYANYMRQVGRFIPRGMYKA